MTLLKLVLNIKKTTRLCFSKSKPLNHVQRLNSTIPAPISAPLISHNKLFINNEFVDALSGKTFETFDPSTGDVIAHVAEADKADVDRAVSAAKQAFRPGSPWRTMDPCQRGNLINKLADLIERDRRYLASLESLNNGKPYSTSFNIDLDFSTSIYRYFAGWADKAHGQLLPISGPFFAYTRHEPVGICGQIIPWNVPLIMLSYKLAPSLAMGNTVVVKLAEQTPLTGLHIAQLTKEAGFPDGVINIIAGFGETAGDAIVRHRDVDKVSFTGSTQVGKQVASLAAQTNLKRHTLELGGKSAQIVFADADMEKAIKNANVGVFFNQGQVCIAGTRVFVEESKYDEFVERSVDYSRSLKIGDPLDPKTEHGSQINETQANKVMWYIKSAVDEGAKLLTGGKRVARPGSYVEPTVFKDVKDHMKIAKEETFGPIMQIDKFTDYRSIIERANDRTQYGLGASVYTKDLDKAIYYANSLRAGTVWVNTYDKFDATAPFGGYKMSGYGREHGSYALQHYSEIKSVIINVTEKNS